MPNLTAPRLVTFLASLILVGLVVASLSVKIPTIGPTIVAHRLGFLIGAYALLALGVVSKSL